MIQKALLLMGLVLARRRWNHLNEVRVDAGLFKFGVHTGEQALAGRNARGRWRKHDGIAAFERVDDVVDRRGERICRRHDGADHADRPGDLGDAFLRHFADDAACLQSRDITQ